MSDSLVLSLTAAIKSTGARDVREGKHIYVYDRQIYIYTVDVRILPSPVTVEVKWHMGPPHNDSPGSHC